MACRSLFRSVLLPDAWRPIPSNHASVSSSSTSSPRLVYPLPNSRSRVLLRPQLRCSHDQSHSLDLSQDDQSPPQEVVLKAISVSKTEGRVAQTTNVVIGGTVTDDSTNEWLALDQKVNSYPTVRGFTAIGTGGDDFVQAMIVAVESVLEQPIPEGRITQKVSSRGKYVSVNIGPVRVVSSEQVQAVYNAMRRDDRMKYFL
ncbi:uncharacterized protein [Aristolochia californica]|uniref:uncharacterized protein isoform X2 n=1 Tax=Aristolochia californica TaxID=171875 RepID=UPI0035D98F3B